MSGSQNTTGLADSLKSIIKPKWLAVPGVAAVAAWTVLAGGDAEACKVDVSRPGNAVCKTEPGPVNVEVRIDATMFRGDPRIADAAGKAAAIATETAIQYGGSIQISAFGRSAARPRVLVEEAVPTRGELRLSRRAGLQEEVRAKIKQALAGLRAADLGEEFAEGSDILGAYTLASSAPLQADLSLMRVVVTDGRVQTPSFNLVSVLRRQSQAAAQRALVTQLPKARGPKPDGLVIAGIGGTGGLIPDEDPALTDVLTVIHERLCTQIAHTCKTTSTL